MIGSVINWATPVFLLGVYGFVCFFYWAHRKTAKNGAVNWTGWEAAGVTVFIYFGAQISGVLLANIVPLLRGWNEKQIAAWFDSNVYGQFFLIFMIEIISIYLLYLFIKRRKSTLAAIGLKGRPRSVELLYILAGFGGYFLAYLALVTLVKNIVPALDTNQQQQIGFSNAQGVELLPVFFSLVVLPPIAEEILVRGFLYSGLRKALPKIWAVILTSGLFAIAHLQAGSGEKLLWVAAIDTFVLSVVLIHLREKTGKLWAPMGLHGLKNSIAFLSIFVFHIVK